MATYVVQAFGRDDRALARAQFVRESFNIRAFLFGLAWLLRNRLWLAALAWLLFLLFDGFVLVPNVAWPAAVAINIAGRIYIGLQGPALKIAKGARRAVVSDVFEARDLAAAEATFYSRLDHQRLDHERLDQANLDHTRLGTETAEDIAR